MKTHLLVVLMVCSIAPLLLASCKHESSLADVPKLSDAYGVTTAVIDNTAKNEDKLCIDYPVGWNNGSPSKNIIGEIKRVVYDNHLELHGDINSYQSIVLVLSPITYLSYKDSLSEIMNIIPQNIEGISKENVLIEDKGDYTILTYSDYVRAHVYKYDSKTTVTIVSVLDSRASPSETSALSNIILGMIKSIRPLY